MFLPWGWEKNPLVLTNGCFCWLVSSPLRLWWPLVILMAPPSPLWSPGSVSCCLAPLWADLRTTITITLRLWPPPPRWSPRRSWAKAHAKGKWRKRSRLLASVRRRLHHHGVNVMGLPIPFRRKGQFDVSPNETLSGRAKWCFLHFPQEGLCKYPTSLSVYDTTWTVLNYLFLVFSHTSAQHGSTRVPGLQESFPHICSLCVNGASAGLPGVHQTLSRFTAAKHFKPWKNDFCFLHYHENKFVSLNKNQNKHFFPGVFCKYPTSLI